MKYGNIYILCGCIFCKDEKFRKKIVELSTKKDYLYNRSEIMNNLEDVYKRQQFVKGQVLSQGLELVWQQQRQ